MSKFSVPIEKYIAEMIFYHLCKVNDEATTRIKINAFLLRKNIKPLSAEEFNTRVRNARSLYDYHKKQKDEKEE
jgi:hypothetical protein